MLAHIGKYQIIEEIGTGSMGTVYKAQDTKLGRVVAIKTIKLPDSEKEKEELAERFKREAKAAGNLSHPNIVIIHDYDEIDDIAFIVMEYVRGRELKSYFDANEAFPEKQIVDIMGQLLSALDYSHRQGVVHRDIKPSNIMITPEGQVRVTDFGIARLESSELTQVGIALGTPSYMSPEQCMGQTVDGRSDIFSAGIVLYQLLTGEKPFPGSSITAIIHKITQVDPPAPSQLNYTISPAFDPVIKRCLAKRPNDRYGSAAEFAAALAGVGRNRKDPARPPASLDDEATIAVPLGGIVGESTGATASDEAEATVAVPLGGEDSGRLTAPPEDHTVAVPLDNLAAAPAEERTVAVPLSGHRAPVLTEEKGRRKRSGGARYLVAAGIAAALIALLVAVVRFMPENYESDSAGGSHTADEQSSPVVGKPERPPAADEGAGSSAPGVTEGAPRPPASTLSESPATPSAVPPVSMPEAIPRPVPKPPAAPPESPQQEVVRAVFIATVPPGAVIEHETQGRIGDTTPLTANLKPGLHQLYISRPGFQDLSVVLEVTAIGEQQLDIKLRPAD